LFDLYRQIPQFQLVNPGFGLDDFKHIFWLEWLHRVWGRLIGIGFLGPLIFFWATNRIERRLRLRLALIFLVGGLQGAAGWFMVASGFLPDTTAVSAYRLVIHLALALLLYGAILWTALSTLQPHPRLASGLALTRGLTFASCGLVVLTMLAGGFVAGTHAGLDYNTFPLMDGRLVPAGYARLQPFVLNWFENIAAIQFNHRLLATLTAITSLAALASGFLEPLPQAVGRRLRMLACAVAVQYALGVLTLINTVPVALAALHQASAMIVLAAALATAHALRRVPRHPSLAAGA
jgi:cytochrome c oxidase assembly protein subunit 15